MLYADRSFVVKYGGICDGRSVYLATVTRMVVRAESEVAGGRGQR
jgi:hypothetical protein